MAFNLELEYVSILKASLFHINWNFLLHNIITKQRSKCYMQTTVAISVSYTYNNMYNTFKLLRYAMNAFDSLEHMLLRT